MRRPRIFDPRETALLLAAVLLSTVTVSAVVGDWLGLEEIPPPLAGAGRAEQVRAPEPLPDLCRRLPRRLLDELVPKAEVRDQVLDRNETKCSWWSADRSTLLTVGVRRAATVDEAIAGLSSGPQGVVDDPPFADLGEDVVAERGADKADVLVRSGVFLYQVQYTGGRTGEREAIEAVGKVVPELARMAGAR